MSHPDQVGSQSRKLEPQSKTAERHGVCSKTIDRWVDAGILPQPTRINGRKYHDSNVVPVR